MNDFAPIVFAGLSLSRTEADALVAASVRPPVRRGDLDSLDDRSVVAIVDGELDAGSMLPLDEIRRALDRGVALRGAASVGALRAYEARADGMEGIGWVYEAYCSGRITGTDEIAVVYQPYSNRPLTVPLVNIRFWLDLLIGKGNVAAEEAIHAMDALKAVSVEQRSPRRVLLTLGHLFGRARLKAALALAPTVESDVKRRDACRLLRAVTRCA